MSNSGGFFIKNNADLFKKALTYGSLDSRTGGTPQYNVNISTTTWQVAGRDKQAYAFKYDDLHRLTESKYFDISDAYTNNKENYRKLARKFNSEKELLDKFMEFLNQRVKESMNMAIFINNNKSVTFEGVKLYQFYPSGSEIHGDKLFEENVFSVVQELPFKYAFEGKQRYSFRPDLTFFMNGIFLGYSELKSNYTNQTAQKPVRRKGFTKLCHKKERFNHCGGQTPNRL